MNALSNLIPQRMVLPLSIAAFLIPIIIVEYPILQFTHGDFAYPIDDSCIHLAIAKNLALHGVWGTYSGEFVSASSSILYPLLLALLIKVVGAHLWLPFFVNVIASIVLLVVVKRWLLKQGIGPTAQFLILCGVIFLTPLAPLAISGMEHVLQFLFTFLFIYRISGELSKIDRPVGRNWRLSPAAYLFAFFMVATRYECMAILCLGSLFLLIKKQILPALWLFLFGMLPVIIFGIYSIRHGNYFFPNSVLLKSETPAFNFASLYGFFTHDLFYRLFYSVVGYNTIATQRCLFMLLLAFLIFQPQLREKPELRYILLILTLAVIIHLSFTGRAQFPRYEAYLIGCVIPILGVLLVKYGVKLTKIGTQISSGHSPTTDKRGLSAWVMYLTMFLLAFPLVLRSTDAFDQVEEGTEFTYKVLYTAGDFLHRYYNHDAVALECLGAMSYFSDGKKMDVVGLGDIEVTKRARAHLYTIDFLDSLSKKENVQIAAGTPISTPPVLLQRWIRVGTWYLPDDVGRYISFYAVNPDRAADLKRNLIEYERFLPAGERAVYQETSK